MKRPGIWIICVLMTLIFAASAACAPKESPVPQTEATETDAPAPQTESAATEMPAEQEQTGTPAAPTPQPVEEQPTAQPITEKPTYTRKHSSYTMLDPDALPEELAERHLSDEELSELHPASLEELTERISSFADYVAWIGQFPADRFICDVVTGDDFGISLDAEKGLAWTNRRIYGANAVGIAQHVLQDDYPGMRIVMMVTETYFLRTVTYGNAIPHENGYYLLSVYPFIDGLEEFDVFSPMFIEDFDAILTYAESSDIEWGVGECVTQIITADSDEWMTFAYDWSACTYEWTPNELTTGTATEFYRYNWEEPTMDRFGFPDAVPSESDIDPAAAEEIMDGTLDEAAERLNSIADVIRWIWYAFEPYTDGDLFFADPDGRMNWHINYAPESAFRLRCNSCGAISPLVAYLLEGDYEDTGIINYTWGGGGGHVIAYFKADGVYYTVDFNSFVNNKCRPDTLNVYCATSLDGVVRAYAASGDAKVAYTCHARNGDALGGWVDDDPHITYLVRDSVEDLHIVFETPQEGYHYEFIDIDDKTKEILLAMRTR